MNMMFYWIISTLLITSSLLILSLLVLPKTISEMRIKNGLDHLRRLLFVLVLSTMMILAIIDYILISRIMGWLDSTPVGNLLILIGMAFLVNALGWKLLYTKQLKH